MEYKQMKQSYLNHGLDDFILNSIEDFKNVFMYDVVNLKGYSSLSPIQQKMFNGFLVNFLNGCGLEYKSNFIPVSVYNVEEIAYGGRDNKEDDFLEYSLKFYILENGKKRLMKNVGYQDNDTYLEIKEFKRQFVRFDYKEYSNKKRSWLHIISESEWY